MFHRKAHTYKNITSLYPEKHNTGKNIPMSESK